MYGGLCSAQGESSIRHLTFCVVVAPCLPPHSPELILRLVFCCCVGAAFQYWLHDSLVGRGDVVCLTEHATAAA